MKKEKTRGRASNFTTPVARAGRDAGSKKPGAARDGNEGSTQVAGSPALDLVLALAHHRAWIDHQRSKIGEKN